jgi:dihydrofolate reductase
LTLGAMNHSAASQAVIVFHLARADNGVIGRDGQLPWHLPADLRRFKVGTMGKPMVMGRKTFDSFPNPLPGRRHIVLTRDPIWSADGAEVARDPEGAVALAGAGEVAVIGGAEVFALFLPHADRIELTEVHATPDGDAVVPAFTGWREVAREDFASEGGRPAYSFVTLVR